MTKNVIKRPTLSYRLILSLCGTAQRTRPVVLIVLLNVLLHCTMQLMLATVIPPCQCRVICWSNYNVSIQRSMFFRRKYGSQSSLPAINLLDNIDSCYRFQLVGRYSQCQKKINVTYNVNVKQLSLNILNAVTYAWQDCSLTCAKKMHFSYSRS